MEVVEVGTGAVEVVLAAEVMAEGDMVSKTQNSFYKHKSD